MSFHHFFLFIVLCEICFDSLCLLAQLSIIATIASCLFLFSRAHALSVSRTRLMPGPAAAEMAGFGAAAGAGPGATTTTANASAADVVGSNASSLPRRAASTSASASPPRGTFIVLEGVDRCGKTTQCARLVERLRESGVRD